MKKLFTLLFAAMVGLSLSMPAMAQDHDNGQGQERKEERKEAKRRHHRHKLHHKRERKEEKREEKQEQKH